MKKQLMILSLVFYASLSFAQTSDGELNYGLYIGAFKPILNTSNELPDKTSIVNGYGFTTGAFIDYPFTTRASVSPKAGISFGESKVAFLEDNIDDYFIMQFYYNLAVDLNFKMYHTSTSPYFSIGAKYSHPFQNINNVSSHEITEKSNYSICIGFGLEKVIMDKFIIAPELKYSNGLTNLNNNPKLTKLYYHSISLILNFKGMHN